MAAFCACCGAEIGPKAEACPACGAPQHGMLPANTGKNRSGEAEAANKELDRDRCRWICPEEKAGVIAVTEP
jgi:hypothetical protein